mmetsp:Transcript_88420/g.245489  ORF Transcript_88420/g.245489 Transcript_88420/m.245489 type:complete len:279 (-) Transcript_88420:59-895(-)
MHFSHGTAIFGHILRALALPTLAWTADGFLHLRQRTLCTHRVLIVLTSSTHLPLVGGRTQSAGNFFSETLLPAMALHGSGCELVYASPRGGGPVFDGVSEVFFRNRSEYMAAKEFSSNPQHGPVRPNIRKLSSITQAEVDGLDAIFIPGGNAVLEDLWRDEELGRILRQLHAAHKVTAALCNGPSALLAAKEQRSGGWPYEGYRMTSFTNAEWELLQPFVKPLYKAQDLLESNSIDFVPGSPMQSHVEEDREVLTGQNPWSTNALVVRLSEKLAEQCR